MIFDILGKKNESCNDAESWATCSRDKQRAGDREATHSPTFLPQMALADDKDLKLLMKYLS